MRNAQDKQGSLDRISEHTDARNKIDHQDTQILKYRHEIRSQYKTANASVKFSDFLISFVFDLLLTCYSAELI